MLANDSFFRKVLQEEWIKRREKNSNYSLRRYARFLGVPAASLSLIINGRSCPSLKNATKMSAALSLAPDLQNKFFSSVAKAQMGRGLKRISRKIREISSMIENETSQDLSLDVFRTISDWYHYAILMIAKTEGFKPDPKWIASQLGMSAADVVLAIDRLKKVGLLEITKKGQWEIQENFTLADKHITTRALKSHQRQILEKALNSLEEDPLELRSMTSHTMAIDPEKIPKAKLLIAKFTKDLEKLLEGGRRKQVYQLGLALFPLQKERKSL
jgi:uncharacterized protein (TIGR02147 family)